MSLDAHRSDATYAPDDDDGAARLALYIEVEARAGGWGVERATASN